MHKTVALIPSQQNRLKLRLGICFPVETLIVLFATKSTLIQCGCLGMLTQLMQIHRYMGYAALFCFVDSVETQHLCSECWAEHQLGDLVIHL